MTPGADAHPPYPHAADEPTAPAAAEATASPTREPTQLELLGYGQARDTIFGIAVGAERLDPAIFDATLEMAERNLRRARLSNAPDEHLDQVEVDIQVMRAVDKLRSQIKNIAERAQARSALRSPAPAPEQLEAIAEAARNGAAAR